MISLLFIIFILGCSNNKDKFIENEETDKEISKLVPLRYNKFTFNSYAPLADKPIDVHTYLPDTSDFIIPLLFVIHGNARNAREYSFD